MVQEKRLLIGGRGRPSGRGIPYERGISPITLDFARQATLTRRQDEQPKGLNFFALRCIVSRSVYQQVSGSDVEQYM